MYKLKKHATIKIGERTGETDEIDWGGIRGHVCALIFEIDFEKNGCFFQRSRGSVYNVYIVI